MSPIKTSTNPSTSYPQTLAPQSSYTHSTSETIENPQHGKRKRTKIEPWESYGNKKLKHDLLKPKVPVTIYNIPWTPPTIEARSDLALLHHRELTPEQQRSSVLNTLLTENERLDLLSMRCSYSSYKSRRIVYVTSQQKKEDPTCDPQEMWNNLFTSKLSEIPASPDPTTVEDKSFVSKIKYCRNVLLQYLNPSMTELFMSLENGTINYEDYCILRSTVCKFAKNKLSPIKAPYFPSIRTCNNTQYLTHTKFYNPTFLLASKAFLQIRPRPASCEQLLSIKGKVTLEKFYAGSFQSIMELEAAASYLSHVMSKISVRALINNAIAIMEQNNILTTTSNINDLTMHQSYQIPSTSLQHIQPRPASIQYQQHKTDTTSKCKTTVSQCTTIRTVNIIQRPKVKIKIVHMDWAIKTSEQKRSLIALQCNILSQEDAEAHISVLSSGLDEHQKSLLIMSKETLAPYSYHRILHIHRTRPTQTRKISVSQIWQDMFISHKEGYVYTAPEEPHIQKALSFYRNQLIELLPLNMELLIAKIEDFSITRTEYIMVREAALNVGKEPYNICTDLFFPSVNTLNSDIQTDLSTYAPKAFEHAARAYLSSILNKPYTSQLLTGEAKDLAKQMRNGSFRSLQELERASSKLIYKYYRGSFINMLDNAAAIMENAGVLPITGDVNDPTSQYEDDSERHYYNTGMSSETSTSENMPTIQRKDTYNTSYQLPTAPPKTPLEATSLLPNKETASLSEKVKESTTELLINKTKSTKEDIPIQRSISQQITTLQLIITDNEPITSAPSITVYDTPQTETSANTITETQSTTSTIKDDIIDKTKYIQISTIEAQPTSPELTLIDNETCTSYSTSIQITETPTDQKKLSLLTSRSKETPEHIVTKRIAKATNSIVRHPARNTTQRIISRRKRTSRSTAIKNTIITRLMNRDTEQYTRLQHLQVSTSINQQEMSPLITKPISSTSSSQPPVQQHIPVHTEDETTQETNTHANKKPLIGYLTPKVPITIYNIPWIPPTTEARSELAKLHHRKLAPQQRQSSILNTLLTEQEIIDILSCLCRYSSYDTKRIIYLPSAAKKDLGGCNTQEQWELLFTSTLTDLPHTPEPTTKEEHVFATRARCLRNLIIKHLNPDMRALFDLLENGTINYDDYTKLRAAALKVKEPHFSSIRTPFFPGLTRCNNTTPSISTKFYNPIFLSASTAFFKIRPLIRSGVKLQSEKQQCTIKQFYKGSFQSLLELEAAASSILHVVSNAKIKNLINHSLAIMERNNILPTQGEINDLTKHPTYQSTSTTIQQVPSTSRAHPTHIGSLVNPDTKYHVQQPRFPVKIVSLDWSPQTSEEKRSVLQLQCNKMPQEEADKIIASLSYRLDRNSINDLILKSDTISTYNSTRIIHICRHKTEKRDKQREHKIWEEMFICHKHDETEHPDIQANVLKANEFYRKKLIALLPASIIPLFLKIETFSITIEEYSQLIKEANKLHKEPNQIYVEAFFPTIVYLNSDTPKYSNIHKIKAFEHAARAYFTAIPGKPYTAQLLTDEEKFHLKRMREGNLNSLKDLEHTASMLLLKLFRTTFLNMLNTAVSIMEKSGTLPIEGDINDPTSQYEEDIDTSFEKQSTSQNVLTTQQYELSRPLPISPQPLQLEELSQSENCLSSEDAIYSSQDITKCTIDQLSIEQPETSAEEIPMVASPSITTLQIIIEEEPPAIKNIGGYRTVEAYPAIRDDTIDITHSTAETTSCTSLHRTMETTQEDSQQNMEFTIEDESQASILSIEIDKDTTNHEGIPTTDNESTSYEKQPTSQDILTIQQDVTSGSLSPLLMYPQHLQLETLSPSKSKNVFSIEDSNHSSQDTVEGIIDQLSMEQSATTTEETPMVESSSITTLQIIIEEESPVSIPDPVIEETGYSCTIKTCSDMSDEIIDLIHSTEEAASSSSPYGIIETTQEDSQSSIELIIDDEPISENMCTEASKRRTTRSMTHGIITTKPLGIHSTRGTSRTRPRKRRSARSNKITQAIITSLINRSYTHTNHHTSPTSKKEMFMCYMNLMPTPTPITTPQMIIEDNPLTSPIEQVIEDIGRETA